MSGCLAQLLADCLVPPTPSKLQPQPQPTLCTSASDPCSPVPCASSVCCSDQLPRRAGSISGRSEAGSEMSRPRGFAREWHGVGGMAWALACLRLAATAPRSRPACLPSLTDLGAVSGPYLLAAGEEEEADEFPLGSSEKPPASLRAPGAGVCQSFRSDRQKQETAPADSTLTKIVIGAPLAALPLLPTWLHSWGMWRLVSPACRPALAAL